MIDRPVAPELLRAMARALTDDVVANTDGQVQYSARIVANLCKILARESALAPNQPTQALAELKTMLPEAGDDLNEALALFDQHISDEPFESGESLYRLLLTDVERRLAVARPQYR